MKISGRVLFTVPVTVRVISAEAVEIDIRPARLGSRAVALAVDIVVQLLLVLLLLVVTGLVLQALPPSLVDGALTDAVLRGSVVVVLLGYPIGMETLTNGRSPGKLMMGLRVIRADGGPIRLRHAATRALVGLAVEWPGLLMPLVTWVVSVGTMLSSRHGRRLGDLAAGTLVVHVRRPAPWLPVPGMPPGLAGWAAVADLSAVDDRLALAVRQFVSRVPQLREPQRTRLERELTAELAARVTPAPPPGTPAGAFLTAVLAERRRRAEAQAAAGRSWSAELLPALSGTPQAPAPLRPASPR